MNQQDLNALTEAWHSDTNWLNDKIDEFFKAAQDSAYALGLKRGLQEAKTTHSSNDTTPPQRKPLSDEQIVDIWAAVSMDHDDEINIIELARAIEAAHGIGDKA